MTTIDESVPMLGFLFADKVDRDPTDTEKLLANEEGQKIVASAREALAGLTEWTTPAIEEALRSKLIDELELKPRNAFGPVRVAVTGRRISPPLFESLELLGRDASLVRLAEAQAVS